MTPILDIDATALLDERRAKIIVRLNEPNLGMKWGEAIEAGAMFPDRLEAARAALREASGR